MGTKYKADSKIGRRLAAAGRSLTQSPNNEGLPDKDMPALGTFVRAVDDDGEQVEGTVRHQYMGIEEDETKNRLGLSVLGRMDLVFVDAESAVPVTKKGLLF